MENKEKQSRYTQILKYTGLFGGVQGMNIMIGLVRNKLVALILGPQGMGLISLFNSTINLVSSATNFGIPTSGVKNISAARENGDDQEAEHQIRLIRSWSMLTAIIGTLICLVLCPLLDRWTFSWGNHTLHFALLSPVIGLMAITGGEMAILKGLHRMRRLAAISVANVVLALVTSVPIYYIWGEKGIVPSLFITALLQMLVTIFYSYHVSPIRISFNKKLLGEGAGMIRLGIAFVLAMVCGNCAEFIIRSYLNRVDSLNILGLYNTAYMIVFTYGGMVFASIEADYFPRLSALASRPAVFNKTVSEQVEASLLMICPMLVVMTFFMPIVIPLLFSESFSRIVMMAQIAVFSLYFRALYLPVAYMNLAKGNSMAFLLLEALSASVLVFAVMQGYQTGGLNGIGYGMLAAHFVDFVVTYLYAAFKFRFRMSKRQCLYMAIQLPLLLLAYFGIQAESAYLYWMWCVLLSLFSCTVSVYFLMKS